MKKLMLMILLSLITLQVSFGHYNQTNQTGIFRILENESVIQDLEVVNPYLKSDYIKIKGEEIKFDINKIKNDFEEALNKESRYYIISFNRKPNNLEINLLKKNGVNIIEFIGDNNSYVKIKNNIFIFDSNSEEIKLDKSIFSDIFFIKSINVIKSKDKIKDKDFKITKDKTIVTVYSYEDSDLDDLSLKLQNIENVKVLNKLQRLNAVNIEVSNIDLNLLTEIDEIKYVEGKLPKGENLLDVSKGVSNIEDLYSNPYNLFGNSINILQYEIGVPYEHSDFKDRLFIEDFLPNEDEHATHVAGILIGNGSINSSYAGVAKKSSIYAYQQDCTITCNYDLDNNFEEGIEDYNTKVLTNSWGNTNCSTLGEYNSMTELIDGFVKGEGIVPTTIVWAAGNQRYCNATGYNTIVPQASAKNVISVGNVYKDLSLRETSSRGPTQNNRLKPELVAPGTNIMSTNGTSEYISLTGTSMAAPHVSGTIALMLEQWNSQYSTDPLPSTIKALLLDSAKDLKQDGSGDEVIDGPDYINGFGLLNAKGAVDRIINETFVESNISDSNDVDVYAINIPALQDTLKITLAWDDVPGANLINDLDMYLISPTGKSYYPWILNPLSPASPATRNVAPFYHDRQNVVEQIYVNDSEIESGEWLLVVDVYDGSDFNLPQKYSLVSENQIKKSRTQITTDQTILSDFKHVNNGIYEVKLNQTNSELNFASIILGNYTYSMNFTSSEQKIFLIKQQNQNLPIYYINYEVNN